MSAFGNFHGWVKQPKRNVFDLSFQNNGTYEFGKLYPVFCKETLPGDTFDIDAAFGLRFMPLQFPVQTRMRANLHFFYVRNRNLWSDWQDFIGNTKDDLVPPYLSPSDSEQLYSQFCTKSLGDYLGIPSEVYSGSGSGSLSAYQSAKWFSWDYTGCNIGLTPQCCLFLYFSDSDYAYGGYLTHEIGTSVNYADYCTVNDDFLSPSDMFKPFCSFSLSDYVANENVNNARQGFFGQIIATNIDSSFSFSDFKITSPYPVGVDVNFADQYSVGDQIYVYAIVVDPEQTSTSISGVISQGKVTGVNRIYATIESIDTASGFVFSLDLSDLDGIGSISGDKGFIVLGYAPMTIGGLDSDNRKPYLMPICPLVSDIVADDPDTDLYVTDATFYRLSKYPLFDDSGIDTINSSLNFGLGSTYVICGSSTSDEDIEVGSVTFADSVDQYSDGSDIIVGHDYDLSSDSSNDQNFSIVSTSVNVSSFTYLADCFGLSLLGLQYSNFKYDSDLISTGLNSSTFETYAPYYWSGNTDGIQISALPFRAYESIYNAFYRNELVDPFQIDGVNEYNKYLPTLAGGPDTNLYELHSALWEKDFLTSAVQSPQQGIAPLVGVSSSGTFTFEDSDGNTYTAKATIDDDGETLSGISSYSEDIPQGSLQMLMDTISHGISINDLRNVNAFQQWLETNIRKGYKYKDQLLSHFGVDAKYEVLDMPEFIGGISRDVNVSQINSTTDTEEMPLGSYAGQASVMGSSKHHVRKYCDEHGFIIGILSITPVPVYKQLLPKFFLKNNLFDYYFPEFGHIGLQPIDYREVCPMLVNSQIVSGETDYSLTDVFGYQRAWYDYLASVDEAHGDFRTNLSDFLLSRTFGGVPELGHDFISVDDESLNDIFSVTSDDYDHILGLLYFEVKAIRPIPKFGIPSLT